MTTSRVGFAHETEASFARFLDFYGIAWDYEPRRFPIVWTESGRAVEFFAPDFYLSEFDLFIEVTAAKPALRTRKNRKVRLLRHHHPHVNVKLFTARDLERLLSRAAQAA